MNLETQTAVRVGQDKKPRASVEEEVESSADSAEDSEDEICGEIDNAPGEEALPFDEDQTAGELGQPVSKYPPIDYTEVPPVSPLGSCDNPVSVTNATGPGIVARGLKGSGQEDCTFPLTRKSTAKDSKEDGNTRTGQGDPSIGEQEVCNILSCHEGCSPSEQAVRNHVRVPPMSLLCPGAVPAMKAPSSSNVATGHKRFGQGA